MTFEAALTAAKSGAAIRHPGMGKGWVLGWHDPDLFAINPHTGSDYLSNPNEADRARTDWSAS